MPDRPVTEPPSSGGVAEEDDRANSARAKIVEPPSSRAHGEPPRSVRAGDDASRAAAPRSTRAGADAHVLLQGPNSRADLADARRNPWTSAALLCAALLILPAIAWILAPRAGGFALPPAETPEPAAATADDAPTTPARVDTAPRPRARAAQTTDSVASDAPVTGVVLDPDGKPVQGAFIGCDDRDTKLATTTDAEGRFTLQPDAAGCRAVSHHPDFVPSERVQLAAGRQNTLRLGRGGAIAGDVVDERNAPIAAFMIAVESFLGTGEAAQAMSPAGTSKSVNDAKGAFVLENLPPGKYVLTASAEGRPPARSRQIEVDAGRTTHHVRITLPRGALLRGTILDAATKRPLAGAMIDLDGATSTSANAITAARADDTGMYALEGVPPGPFSIRVMKDGYRTRTISGLTTRGAAQIQQDVELSLLGDGGAASEYAGIGAVLAPQATGVIVSSLIAGGPAEQSGVKKGDALVKIDGLDVTGLPLSDCVQRLRGPDGTTVSLTVKHTDGTMADLTITRRAFTR